MRCGAKIYLFAVSTGDDIIREIRLTLLWVAGLAVLFLFVWYAWELIFLAFAGFLLAIILRTFSTWFEEHAHLKPNPAYAAAVSTVVVVIGLAAWLIAPRAIAEAGEIAQIIPKSLAQAKQFLNQSQWGQYVVKVAQRALADIGSGAKFTHVSAEVADAVAAALIVLVVGFYAALNPEGYAKGLLALVPAPYRERARQVAGEVIYTLRWWLLGQLVPMVVLGIATMIGLWALGVPLAFTLGLFTALMIFIPYLGALLSEIPALLVALTKGPQMMLYVLVLYLGIHGMEAYVLTPLVQKKAIRLPPIVTILSQFLMWTLTGFLGVAIATPLAATILVLVKMLYLHQNVERS